MDESRIQPKPLAVLIAEIDELAAKATPGPWLCRYKSDSLHSAPPEGTSFTYGAHFMQLGQESGDYREGDIEFVLALRNAWPTLRDALAALERERDEANLRLLTAGLIRGRPSAELLAAIEQSSPEVRALFATVFNPAESTQEPQ